MNDMTLLALLYAIMLVVVPASAQAQGTVPSLQNMADRASAICERPYDWYRCDVSEKTKYINGRWVQCMSGYRCQQSDAESAFVVGKCYWKKEEGRGRCYATHYRGADGMMHSVYSSSVHSLPPASPEIQEDGLPLPAVPDSRLIETTGMLRSFSDQTSLEQQANITAADTSRAFTFGNGFGEWLRQSAQDPLGAFNETFENSVSPAPKPAPQGVASPSPHQPTYDLGTAGSIPEPVDISTSFTTVQPTAISVQDTFASSENVAPTREASWYDRLGNAVATEWNSLCWSGFDCFTNSVQNVFRCRSSICQ